MQYIPVEIKYKVQKLSSQRKVKGIATYQMLQLYEVKTRGAKKDSIQGIFNLPSGLYKPCLDKCHLSTLSTLMFPSIVTSQKQGSG